jgi:hypothetical protein
MLGNAIADIAGALSSSRRSRGIRGAHQMGSEIFDRDQSDVSLSKCCCNDSPAIPRRSVQLGGSASTP